MWMLTIEDDEGQRTLLELSDDEYSLGRAEEASIRLTERNVSRRHAKLRPSPDGGWVVEDDGSYNGTFVGGQKIEAATPLGTGAHLQIGDYRLELVDHKVAAPPVDDTRRITRPDRLVVVIGPAPGMEYPLTGDCVSVGRAEEAQVSINHASVSRLHCEMHALGQGRWEVVDQGSSNGIRINGVDLRRGIIEPGDAFELGDVRLRYVAAGKLYRPGADMSQELRAVSAFDVSGPSGSLPSAMPRPRGPALAIALVLGLLVLAVGGFLATRPTDTSGAALAASGAPNPTSDADARKLLEFARGLSDGAGDDDDLEFAHKALARIPEQSPVRELPEFRAIEDAWADHLFALAERETELGPKRALLTRISETGTVSAEKRKRAADLAATLRAPIDLDGGRRAPTPTAPTLATGGGATRLPPPPTGTIATTNVAPSAPPPPDKPDQFDGSSQKPGLLAKMHSGRATAGELSMLKAICMGDGDRACRNAAIAAQQKLKQP
ncbi:MAG: FHA domain-containing protein [Myxococcales bacterium]|nr:FHA domain-containing protein [Myxococcales bacterium]